MNEAPTTSQNSKGTTLRQGLQYFWAMLLDGLKGKRISYLTIPLLLMATVTEFVILTTGWNYQRAVCVPPGMGVTFFGIGPIGATILAVELLKLPLAIWTASRMGWLKVFMVSIGLPLICLLTFQLVKDMAVYEMGVAMQPASEFLEKASAEEIKINQLKDELVAIEEKKSDRDQKLAELDTQKAKVRAELEDQLKRNDVMRQEAINLTDYQQKELSEVESRQAAIVRQFNNDTVPLTRALADLRARREAEFPRAAAWNAEQARIDNEFNKKMAEHNKKKAAYEKDKEDYAKAGYIRRKLMGEPVDPGAPPEKEINKIVKPTLIAELDTQIATKEAELTAVNNKRRERLAQVSDDAQRIREEFNKRSTVKRDEIDRKREEILASQAALETKWQAERKEIEQEFTKAATSVDALRAEIDAHRKLAEKFYESREASIKDTQVHRIATTVEIIRGLLFGKHPVSITATARERGDIYTDQVSMVRIWVYPVLAFIVAFLPTLMVEIGFSTIFHKEQGRKSPRLGFFASNLHSIYTRAGRFKIVRAERLAREASEARAASEKTLLEKTAALKTAQETVATIDAKHEELTKKREEEWDAKFAGLTDSLNQAIMEKDALRDFQQLEIERQVQLRQDGWNERLTQVRQELEAQHASHESERVAMIQEHQKKLQEVTEDCRAQISQLRRQMDDAELAAEEKSTRLASELKEAVTAREAADTQLKQQTEILSLKLTQASETAARELEKAARQEKQRLESQQAEFDRILRQRTEESEHQLERREQELALELDARLAQEQTRAGQDGRRREEEFERQLETRVAEVDAQWNQELQQREAAAETRLKQREEQLQAQAEVRLNEVQSQAAQDLRRREAEVERKLAAQAREAETRLRNELQQKELEYLGKFRQREQEQAGKISAREDELHSQWAADLRVREEEWERQAVARVQAAETRLAREAQEKDEQFQSRLRQHDLQWHTKLDAARTELQAQNEQLLRRREEDAAAHARALQELEAGLRREMQQREEQARARAAQREQELTDQLAAQADARLKTERQEWEQESEKKIFTAISPFKLSLARVEQERDETKHFALTAQNRVQELEKKLSDASAFLNGWKNGHNSDGNHGNGNHGNGHNHNPVIIAGRG